MGWACTKFQSVKNLLLCFAYVFVCMVLHQVVSSSTLQMSGGTVYTNDNTPAPSDGNDLPINFTNIDALSQPNQLEVINQPIIYSITSQDPQPSKENKSKVTVQISHHLIKKRIQGYQRHGNLFFRSAIAG